MMFFAPRIWIFASLLLTAAAIGHAAEGDGAPEEVAPDEPPPAAPAEARSAPARAPTEREPVWRESIAKGTTEARRFERPIFLKAGGENCRFCRALDAELAKPELANELKRWTLVAIDVDDAPADARLMAVDAIPALRILTPAGKLVAAREGFLPADELAEWLKEYFEDASVPTAPELLEEGPPEALAVTRLIGEFRNRDAAIREAAVRRLIPYPDRAAPSVVAAFSEGTLATRLAALELLQEWHAPLEGVDPWHPETLTAARLKTLGDWSRLAEISGALPTRTQLSDEEERSAGDLLARMLTAPPDEARAIREGLARYGRLLLPRVYERLKSSTTDAEREQLTALRYRLVAPESLALGWSGGLERLAASEADVRFRAAEELVQRATPAEEPLLLELFSDPAPLVRELSLRALNAVGGTNSHRALIRLLDDPEPNVRAAVLRQLAESPSRQIVPRITEYAAQETDPDLVVHAIRVLREAKGPSAAEALMQLLSHQSWQVRAEAAEGLGKFLDHGSDADALKADIYSAMIGLLDDSDGFVLSRAVTVLQHADLIAAVEPLARAAESHPELAREVLGSLSYGSSQRAQALVHMRRFSTHANPKLRAAAIGALCHLRDNDVETLLHAALRDPELDVRLAAAGGFFEMLNQERRAGWNAPGEPEDAEPVVEAPSANESFVGGLIRGLFGGPPEAKRDVVETPSAEAADSQPTPLDESSPEPAPDRIQATLQKIRSGKHLSANWFALADDLTPMLSGPLAEERLAAALPLAALGRDEAALPELLRLIRENRRFLARAAEALPWFPSPHHETLLAELVANATSADDVGAIATQLVSWRGTRADGELWSLFALPWIDAMAAETLKSSMLRFYFPNHYYRLDNVGASAKKRAIAAVLPRARSGPHWQRIAALAILLPLGEESVSEIARGLASDGSHEPASRVDAFQVLLAAVSEEQGTTEALAQLTRGSPVEMSDVALTFLTRGPDAMHSLREGRFEVSASRRNGIHSTSSTGQPIVPEPPAGLEAEPLMPLLSSPNPRVVAQAGYLLALLERDDGLEPLINFWRSHAQNDPTWMRLVYRAIARLDDGTRVPVLKEIYLKLNTEEQRYYLPEFYWTLRSMTHADTFPLRKQIRQEVGMDQLR